MVDNLRVAYEGDDPLELMSPAPTGADRRQCGAGAALIQREFGLEQREPVDLSLLTPGDIRRELLLD
jgi:hypothetical protein